MQPRPVIAGACVLVTRRCFGRQFLLRPDADTTALFAYVLAVAAERYRIDILGAALMSNHYHLVVHDPHAELPCFIGYLNAELTRRVNRLRGRSDTIWDTRQPSCVELADAGAVLEALAYVHLNPVSAGLVPSPDVWPGLLTGPEDLRTDPAEGRVYKRPERLYGGRSSLPDRIPLVVRIPPTHAHLTRHAFAELLTARIRVRLAWLLHGLSRLGHPFGSPEDVLSAPCQTVPTTAPGADADDLHEGLLDLAFGLHILDPDLPLPLQPGSALQDDASSPCSLEPDCRSRPISPKVKASSASRRAGVLDRLRCFRDAYARALRDLRNGLLARFPGSSFRLPRLMPWLLSGPPMLPAWRIP